MENSGLFTIESICRAPFSLGRLFQSFPDSVRCILEYL
jgi:hypothetical protein